MKVLLDTNIIIERESSSMNHKGIGELYYWLDRIGYSKCIHNITIEEINKHKDKKIKKSFSIKLQSYTLLKAIAPLDGTILKISNEIDLNANDKNDTQLLNELYKNRVDFLITEDKKIHHKARLLGIDSKVFKIENFLEKVIAENPDLIEYKNIIAKKEIFGNVPLNDSFFDSFRKNYSGFDEWFNKKAEEPAYVCFSDKGEVLAFLYLKIEDKSEDYHSEGKEIIPAFSSKKRLKIGTFKVTLNGYKLGERFLKIIFDNAIKQKVEEIYVTIFNDDRDKERLIVLLETWGFNHWGIKETKNGKEEVYVRDFKKDFNEENPKLSFPYISIKSNVYFIPIFPEFHTDLLPDSMLNNESTKSFLENKAYRNAISKVYVTHAPLSNMKKGDTLLFYRTGIKGNARHTGVITTLGIVNSVIKDIPNEEELFKICSKKSVFERRQLRELWKKFSRKPIVINFLYAYSFPKRITLQTLIDLDVIISPMNLPRFEIIPKENFKKIIESTETDNQIIIQ